MSLPYRETLRAAVPAHAHSFLTAASAVWLGCIVGLSGAWAVAVVAGVGAALLARRHLRAAVAVALVAAGVVSGAAAGMRAAATLGSPLPPSGSIEFSARLVTDPVPGGFGPLLMVSTIGDEAGGWPPPGIRVVVETEEPLPFAAGDVVRITGSLRDRPGRLRGESYRATVVRAEVTRLRGPDGPFFGVGNLLRAVILDRLDGEEHRTESALLAGFLVGDTSGLPEAELENLRRSGLTHFVAVSGSNVALFLGAWWLVAGPLRFGPRLRATSGLAALGVFVVATRWEPSVVRAATMAAIVLSGRLAGLPVDAWRALGSAVVVLLLTSGDLATDVGFQLSVAATAGVLVGSRLAGSQAASWVRTILVATVGAQLAVLPILLLRFGSVPLMSPAANLVAAPLVTAATALGGAGLLPGAGALLDLGLGAAGGVLFVARHAARWPQVGALGAAAAIGAGMAVRVRALRPVVAGGVLAVFVVVQWPVGPPAVPTLTFLDVGQGDAIVLRDPSGATALVDGGRDPLVLSGALQRHGIGRLDLLVVTHGDADHVAGLVGLGDHVHIGSLWYPADQPLGEILPGVIDAARSRGTALHAVSSGDRARLGSIDIRVLGPLRRYASDNDGSVVLWAAVGSAAALLTGDVEAVGQAELPAVRPDVLQVPHHGSATTDIDWLLATVGAVAVVSVGPNPYGHPSAEVLMAIEAAGGAVYTTQEYGDVTVPLCAPCPVPP